MPTLALPGRLWVGKRRKLRKGKIRDKTGKKECVCVCVCIGWWDRVLFPHVNLSYGPFSSRFLFSSSILLTIHPHFKLFCRHSLYHRHQQLPAAAAHYAEAIRLQPNFVECHANLGHVLRDSGDLQVCICVEIGVQLKKGGGEF